MDIKEIINAWVTSYNPTIREKELANLRGAICGPCPAKKSLLTIPICSECGCPISKKIFSSHQNPCPLKKWEEIDKPYFPSKKNSLTLL